MQSFTNIEKVAVIIEVNGFIHQLALSKTAEKQLMFVLPTLFDDYIVKAFDEPLDGVSMDRHKEEELKNE